MTPRPTLSLNARALPLVDALAADALALRVGVGRGLGGETLIDCGHRHPGGTEAGLALARDRSSDTSSEADVFAASSLRHTRRAQRR